ncbi:MAG: metalloregulator ArsR/SmtB family transcription factor [Cytophagaceae bacterium]|nr:metalloregulator ArsR/SmtB family transcription factor [Cytophagaceae bacterium]
MGVTKKDNFNHTQNTIAQLAKAIGHPARIAILELLIKKNSCICGDIVDQLPLAQATISQHLRELKEAGLIKGQIEGASICYCIDEKAWKEAQKILNRLFDSYKTGSGSL